MWLVGNFAASTIKIENMRAQRQNGHYSWRTISGIRKEDVRPGVIGRTKAGFAQGFIPDIQTSCRREARSMLPPSKRLMRLPKTKESGAAGAKLTDAEKSDLDGNFSTDQPGAQFCA